MGARVNTSSFVHRVIDQGAQPCIFCLRAFGLRSHLKAQTCVAGHIFVRVETIQQLTARTVERGVKLVEELNLLL